MRIVGGSLRGRRLQAPDGGETRPTSDRAREAVFNILEHGTLAREGFVITGASVVDAFAGTGALGLEALSRGATEVSFFEASPQALSALRGNIRSLGVEDRARIVAGDAMLPSHARSPSRLMFLDPPYNMQLGPPAVERFVRQGWLAPGAMIVLEVGAKERVPPVSACVLIDERIYGAARFLFLRYDGG